MISHENKIIFLHIPKTGGTSINDALIQCQYPEESVESLTKESQIHSVTSGSPTGISFFSNQVTRIGDIPSNLKKDAFFEEYRRTRHSNIRGLSLSKAECDNYKIFTILRNPFTRIASSYNHFIFGTDNSKHAEPFTKETYSFKEYIKNIQRYFNGELIVSLPDKNGEGNYIFRAFTKENLEKCLHPKKNKKSEPLIFLLDIRHIERLAWWTQTTDKLEANCQILRFENLNSDWDKYKNTIGIKTSIEHLNQNTITGTDDYMSYYDDETYGIIEALYKEELTLFKEMQDK